MSSTPARIREVMSSAIIAAGPIGRTSEIVDAIYEALENCDMLDLEKPELVDEGPDILEDTIASIDPDKQAKVRADI